MLRRRTSLVSLGCLLAGIVGLSVVSANAAPVVIQPDAAASNDTWIYQFQPNDQHDSGPFGTILATANTGGAGHDIRTLISFDLTGVTIAPDELATLNFHVISGQSLGFSVDPTPASPVTVDAFALQSSFTASTATWNNQPAASATAAGTVLIDHVGYWVSIDITPLAQAWLADPSSNHGVVLTQREIGFAAPVFESASGAERPYFQVAPVPEPAAACGVAGALVVLSCRRRRK